MNFVYFSGFDNVRPSAILLRFTKLRRSEFSVDPFSSRLGWICNRLRTSIVSVSNISLILRLSSLNQFIRGHQGQTVFTTTDY